MIHSVRPPKFSSSSFIIITNHPFLCTYVAWLGDDYPNAASIDFGDPVSLTIEDSRHYALNNPESEAEYFSIYPGEYLGFVHLGPNKRFFGLSMYHQIHCLASLRKAILGITHDHRKKRQDGMGTGMGMDEAEIGHTHHCLNYLRQTILCSADVTLEPEVPEGSQDVGEGLGVTHVCRDWGKVYDYVKRNEAEWLMWRNGTGN